MRKYIKKWFRQVVRHPYGWLAGSFLLCLCGPVSDQLLNLSYVVSGRIYPDWRDDLTTVFFWIGLLGINVFSDCLAMVFRHTLLSEKWLMMIFTFALYMLLPVFGVQYPYCDPPLQEHLLLEYLAIVASGCFLWGGIVIGPQLLFLHFALRKKTRRIALSRRIAAPAVAVLLSAFLLLALMRAVSLVL